MFGDWVVTKRSSPTEPGIKTRTCEHCGETETEEIPQTGSNTGIFVLIAVGSMICLAAVFAIFSKKRIRTE